MIKAMEREGGEGESVCECERERDGMIRTLTDDMTLTC